MGKTDNNLSRINPVHYRAIFISDVHLGFSGCSADFLLDFLRSTTCDYLYLVGDIVDIWSMKKKMYWPQAHNNVIRSILGKAKHGTQVVYIPGNHDEMLRDFDTIQFGNLQINNDVVIHTTRSGKRLLVIHGDQFDTVVRSSKLMAVFGCQLYDTLLKVNGIINWMRRSLGLEYWSLAGMLKKRVKKAVNYISNFESALVYAAEKHQVDGVVSGHIHQAELSRINDLLYCNCGDWVESCTALVETHDGKLQLIRWTEQQQLMKAHLPAAA